MAHVIKAFQAMVNAKPGLVRIIGLESIAIVVQAILLVLVAINVRLDFMDLHALVRFLAVLTRREFA